MLGLKRTNINLELTINLKHVYRPLVIDSSKT